MANETYKSDIEIAQSAKMLPICEVAKQCGIDLDLIENYGKYKAKIDYAPVLEKGGEKGKLVLVTAITPTPAGEGKTTTTIGLADGLRRIGKNAMVALREPSLGPVFGVKGGHIFFSPISSPCCKIVEAQNECSRLWLQNMKSIHWNG